MARKKKNVGSSLLTTPETREEHYLAKIAGLVNTKPEYPITRLERYLDAIADSSGFSPTEAQLAAMNSGATEAKINAIEEKTPMIGNGDNILINSYFDHIVNQRGLPSYDAIGFTIDCWYNESTATIAPGDGVLNITPSAANQVIYQFFEDGILKPNTQYTGSILFSNGSLVTGTAITTVDGSYVDLFRDSNIVYGLRKHTSKNLWCFAMACVVPDETISIKRIKLERGSKQTLATKVGDIWIENEVAPNYAGELMKCQRYLWLMGNVSANSYVCADGVANTTTSAIFTLYLPQNLRETGNAIMIANSVAVYSNTDNSTRNCTGISIASLVGNNLGVSAAISGATPGESVRLVVIQGGSFGISKE